MTRALDATQSALVYKQQMARLDLVKLTTYSDRPAATVSQTFYLAKQALRYDYGNTGSDKEFDPLLLSVGPLEMSMNHLPAAKDTELIERTLTVVLSNATLRGERFAATLEGEALAGARIEWAQLLVPPETLTQAGPRIDLTAYTGAELTYFFRGEVIRAAPITQDSITLQCATEYATAGFYEANGEDTDPRDVGRRLPVVFGQGKKIPAINYVVGWVTTLAQDIDAADAGTVSVADTSGFVVGSFTVQIGFERMLVEVASATTLTILSRGTMSTTAKPHMVGDQISEIPFAAVFILADHASEAVDQVYARNFFGNLVAVNLGTLDLADTTTISGRTLTTLTLDEADLRLLFNALSMRNIDETETSGGLSTVTNNYGSVTVLTSGGGPGSTANAGTVTIDGTANPADDDQLSFTWAAGSANQVVVRWRIKASGSATDVDSTEHDLNLIPENFPGTQPGTITQHSADPGTTTFTNVYGAYATPPEGTTMADLASGGLRVRMHYDRDGPGAAVSGSTAIITALAIEADISTLIVPGNISTVNGFGLELFADIDGIAAPSASPAYEAGTGNLIEVPADVIRYWVEEVGGFAVDTTTLAAYAGELASAMRFDARSLGATWASVLARLSFEGAVNLIPEEVAAGTAWKLLAPEFDGTEATFPAAAAEITAWERGGFVEADVDVVNQLRTRLAAFYGYEAWRGNAEDAFTKLRHADPDTTAGVAADTEMEAAEDAYGRRDADPLFFLTHAEDGDLDEAVVGYYAQEMSRAGRTYAIKGIPWWEGYALEPGDIRTIVVPWSGTSRKVRILSVIKDPVTELVEIRALEVL